MKTNKMPSKKHRFELWLTITGWTLAVFVSFLYLAEIKAQSMASPAPAPSSSVDSALSSERVNSLLIEARSLLMAERPDEAIERITTLWSVCHSNQQPVPEQSHRIFAEAVSALSEKSSGHPFRPPLDHPPHWNHPQDQEEAPVEVRPAKSSKVVKKPSTEKVTFKLSERNYPKATVKAAPSKQVKDESSQASPQSRPRPNVSSGFPPPPPPYQARSGQDDRRFPGHLDREGYPRPPRGPGAG